MDETNLSKSLYRAVLKALGSTEGKQHAVDHIVSDIQDPDMQAQAPNDHIPAAKEGVLHKDVSVSEMHQQKQAAAEANMGMRPGEQKGMKKMNYAAMMGMSEGVKERGLDKLRKFMEKSAMKKAQKGVHVPAKPQMPSDASILNTMKLPQPAKEEHKRVLSEMKQMPKPNLPKSEEMDKMAPASAPATPPMPASAKRIISKPTMPKPSQKPASMMMSEEKRILKRK